jgi:predicted ferric reductase
LTGVLSVTPWAARPKFIERYFGMDKLYRSHGYLAVASVILVTLHRTILEAAMGETTTAKLGTAAWITFSAVVVVTLLFMVNTRIRLRTVKYQHLKAFHNLSAIGLVLMLIHVLMTYSAETIAAVRVIYAAYFAAATIFYLYHRIVRPQMLKRNLYKVISILKEADTMWTVKLSPLNGEKLPFKPGQFGYLTIYGETISREAHPFSFSSSPDDDNSLTFTIKELGDYTSSIGNIRPGGTATIDGPYGRFSYLNYPDEEITVLIAGGVGITPALSMLRYMRHRDKEHKALLLWGANNRDELICYDELREMIKEMSSFSLILVIFRDDSWDGEKGFIDKPLLQ